MLVCPVDNTVVWFCSLHRKPSSDMRQVVLGYDLINFKLVCIICKLLIFWILVQLMFVMFLVEDLRPHPKTFVGYILKYLILHIILNLIY